ncbi:hypothetical protein BX616_003101, partial [Lobosporangium transversale]
MLQRVSVIKPTRLVTNVNRYINHEARAYLSTKPTSQEDTVKASAVYKRLGIELSDPELMTQSITHKSFAHATVPTNERLGALGRTFLELHVTEQNWDKTKSNDTLKASVSHSLRMDTLAKIARSMGVDEAMRWKSPS